MTHQFDAYVTGIGSYLPGDPVPNGRIEQHLGAGRTRLRDRMLEANGIVTRHYALDDTGTVTMLNEELAERAGRQALADRGLDPADVGFLSAGTTQPDLVVPGFASMVHGRLGGGPSEILSAAGVCCSGMAALIAAENTIRVGRHRVALAIGSELASRALRSSRLVAMDETDRAATFSAEFLRWMLSDGAGAMVVEPQPRPDGLSLRIDWSVLESHAHRFPVCMYAGVDDPDQVVPGHTWQDLPTAAEAERRGMLSLRQDVARLDAVVALGVERYIALVGDGRIDPDEIDHLLVHYSSESFRGPIVKLMAEAGLMIPEDRWFTNLHTVGNTGAASIYIMLAEAMETGRIGPGDRVLLMVPESGRFSVAFVHLTCVGPDDDLTNDRPQLRTENHNPPGLVAETKPEIVDPVESAASTSVNDRLIEELAVVWTEFEQRLAEVPIVRRIEHHTATIDDYRNLLRNMRQQVMEGARWITRAASNLTVAHTELRADFIHHAAEEQRDFRMLERDYVACGGSLDEILGADKNIGSAALSAFMFHQADQTDPLDLLGAMYIIEGLGANKADGWMRDLRTQLDLADDQVTFLHYHGGADEEHTEEMFRILRSDLITDEVARAVVKTARVVARLYALQLEEVDHV